MKLDVKENGNFRDVDSEYVSGKVGGDSVTLDGEFSVADLRHVIVLMEGDKE